MVNKLYNEEHIKDIANAIREKSYSNEKYDVSEMAEAIRNIKVNGIIVADDGEGNVVIGE